MFFDKQHLKKYIKSIWMPVVDVLVIAVIIWFFLDNKPTSTDEDNNSIIVTNKYNSSLIETNCFSCKGSGLVECYNCYGSGVDYLY